MMSGTPGASAHRRSMKAQASAGSGSSSITITSGAACISSKAPASATLASAVVSRPASPKADK